MANLQMARLQIEQACGKVVTASGIYQTEAWGPVPQPAYLNQVLHLHTGLGPMVLLRRLLQIETSMGRQRSERYGPRTIDIDILFYNDAILVTPELTLPHPRLHTRRFVLEPLYDVAPGLVHPVLGLTIAELLAACPDTLDVKKIIAQDAAE